MNNTKKRILIFSTAYAPFVGGAEIAVKEITDRLSEYEFVMITAKLSHSLNNYEKIGNVEVHRIGSGGCLDKVKLVIFGSTIAAELGKFDLVWGIMASYGGFTALRYKKRTNTPFLLTLQEGDSLPHIYSRVWWCWWYFKQMFTQANHVQAISTYLADWAKRMGASCEIDSVPNGVDTKNFVLDAEKGFEIKKQLCIPSNSKVIITVSRLVEKNGIADLVHSMTYIPDNVHLVIVGSGHLLNFLKKLCKKIKVTERVHFVGEITREEIPGYISCADVFCRPSRSEGQGIAFLEAMNVGIPVVATRAGGIPDFLFDEITGLLCNTKDPKDIARKIMRCIKDNNLRQKIVMRAKENVHTKYDWNSIAGRMKEIFEMIYV